MSSRQQVIENCQSADNSAVNSFSQNDHLTIQKIVSVLKKGNLVPCTGCGYCSPCPSGVSIPRNFAMLNHMLTEGGAVMDIWMRRQIKKDYNSLAQTKEEQKTTGKDGSSLLCVECGECVPKCPQSINIPEELKKVNQVISKQKITGKEILQMVIYGIKNWRLVVSRLRN